MGTRLEWFVMPPTLKTLRGHIALGLSVYPSFRPSKKSLRCIHVLRTIV